jgi:cell division protein FtsQ
MGKSMGQECPTHWFPQADSRVKKKDCRMKKRTRKMKRIKIIKVIIFLGAMSCLGGGINYLYHYLTSSPYFNLTEIEIVGTQYLDKKALQKFLQLDTGMNFFSLNLKRLNQQLSMHQWIKDGFVKRVIPDKVIVSIVERAPVASIELGGKFLVAEDGEILAPLKSTGDLQLPLITGLGDQEGIKTKLRRGAELLIILHALPWMAAKGITKMDLTLIERPIVFLKENKTEIRLSISRLKQNLSYLQAFLPLMDEKKNGIAYIDLSFKGLVIVKSL